MYSCKDRVSYSRVDTQGRLKAYAILNAMQDCCLFQCEDIGMSCLNLKEQSRAWLVNSWHIVINERPLMGQEFKVSTWPYKFMGVFGMRNFVMESEEGETLAYADSHWFYFDMTKGVPIKATPEEAAPYGMGDPYPMKYGSRKVKFPEDITEIDKVEVCENLFDTNSHVNNGEYIRIASNYLPVGFEVGEMFIEYKLAAKMGDTMHIFVKDARGEEDGFYVVIADSEKNPYVITKFVEKR